MKARLHYLSSFWDFLNTEDLLQGNPVKKVGLLKLEKVIKKPFSAEKLAALNVGDVKIGKQELIVYGKGSGISR